MTATYYDHATNHTNAAEAHAVAAVRRDAIAEGTAYRVEANWPGKPRFYWNGGRYDAFGLAKSLVFNRAEDVTLTRPTGEVLGAEAIRALTY